MCSSLCFNGDCTYLAAVCGGCVEGDAGGGVWGGGAEEAIHSGITGQATYSELINTIKLRISMWG